MENSATPVSQEYTWSLPANYTRASPGPQASDSSSPCQPAAPPKPRSAPPRARHALLDFLHLGPGRSITGLLERYRSQDSPPTRSLATLRMWSAQYGWPRQATRFDANEEERARKEYRARRNAVIQTGLALDYERIEHLSALFNRLYALLSNDEALWITDVKVLHLGNGLVERVELRRFNGDLIRILRGLLDDIARETGGRTNAPSLPNEHDKYMQEAMDKVHLDMLTNEERLEFFRMQDKIFSRPIRENLWPEKDI